MIPNAHFKKHWAERVRTWFDQPARKLRRRRQRLVKAAAIAPTPVGLLRPSVHCPTQRYNVRLRLGQGFTLAEIKAAGLTVADAKRLGVAVDARRTNKSVESLNRNADRIRAYLAKVVVISKDAKGFSGLGVAKAAATDDQITTAVQVGKVVVHAGNDKTFVTTVDELPQEEPISAVSTLRVAWREKKFAGRRARRLAQLEAERAAQAKKKAKGRR